MDNFIVNNPPSSQTCGNDTSVDNVNSANRLIFSVDLNYILVDPDLTHQKECTLSLTSEKAVNEEFQRHQQSNEKMNQRDVSQAVLEDQIVNSMNNYVHLNDPNSKQTIP